MTVPSARSATTSRPASAPWRLYSPAKPPNPWRTHRGYRTANSPNTASRVSVKGAKGSHLMAHSAECAIRCDPLAPLTLTRDAVLGELAVRYPRWVRQGFGGFAGEYNRHGALAGRDVVAERADGTVIAAGRAGNVDENGHLLVKSHNGTVKIATGEVHLRPC